MVVIYDIAKYRTPRLLKSFSQQTGDVVRQFRDFDRHMEKLSAGLCRIQEAQRAFASQLSACLLSLEKTKEFARTCSAACELRSTERMIKKRDQIIRERLKETDPPAKA